MTLVGLAVEPEPRPPPPRRALDPGRREPLIPPFVVGADQRQVRQVRRLDRPPQFRLGPLEARRRAHRREIDRHQLDRIEPLPRPRPRPDRDIGLPRLEVDQPVARRQPHRKVGMLDLERPQPPRQPGVGEGESRRHRQQRLVIRADRRERLLDPVERLRQRRQQPRPERGQARPPPLAHEQRRANALFECLDLIAHRGLGHPQFDRRGSEILKPPSRLKCPHRRQRRKLPHITLHKLALWIPLPFGLGKTKLPHYFLRRRAVDAHIETVARKGP